MFARQRDSSAAAVSKTLRQLIDKGLVHVSLSPHDGRQRKYQLSEQGENVMQQLRTERANAIMAVWTTFTTSELTTFTEFGTKLAEALEQYGQRGAGKEYHGQDAVRKSV
jgi:DNA-binding MarR family transcriptional regulator